MTVLDSPLQNGGLTLDDPEQVSSGVREGVLGSVGVTGFAAAVAISSIAVGVLGSVDCQGFYPGFEAAPGGLLDGIVDPDGDPLSLEIVAVPPNGTFDWDVNGAFTFTPDPGFHGETQGQYRVWAGGEPSNTETFTIHVDASFDGVLGSVDVQGFVPGMEVSIETPGVLGSVDVVGYVPTLVAGQGSVSTGVLGSVDVTGYAASLQGPSQGALGSVDVQGYAGALVSTFEAQGAMGSVGVQGYVPGLEINTTFVGVLGSVDVQGFVPGITGLDDPVLIPKNSELVAIVEHVDLVLAL